MKRFTLGLAILACGCSPVMIQQNPVLAKSEYKKGAAFLFGKEAPKDPVSARDWFQKSASHGSVDAQYALGWMYLRGDGIPQDLDLAETWFLEAANHGDAKSQAGLAMLYKAQGKTTLAVKWLREAAGQGHIPAQLLLGKVFAYGVGIQADHKEAEKWLRIASAQGDKDAKKLLAELPTIPCGTLSNLFFNPDRIPMEDGIYNNPSQDGVMVEQVTSNGFLISQFGMNERRLFIYRSVNFGKSLVDNIPLPSGNYKFVGPYTYNSLLGPRTIYSFKPI